MSRDKAGSAFVVGFLMMLTFMLFGDMSAFDKLIGWLASATAVYYLWFNHEGG